MGTDIRQHCTGKARWAVGHGCDRYRWRPAKPQHFRDAGQRPQWARFRGLLDQHGLSCHSRATWFAGSVLASPEDRDVHVDKTQLVAAWNWDGETPRQSRCKPCRLSQTKTRRCGLGDHSYSGVRSPSCAFIENVAEDRDVYRRCRHPREQRGNTSVQASRTNRGVAWSAARRLCRRSVGSSGPIAGPLHPRSDELACQRFQGELA